MSLSLPSNLILSSLIFILVSSTRLVFKSTVNYAGSADRVPKLSCGYERRIYSYAKLPLSSFVSQKAILASASSIFLSLA